MQHDRGAGEGSRENSAARGVDRDPRGSAPARGGGAQHSRDSGSSAQPNAVPEAVVEGQAAEALGKLVGEAEPEELMRFTAQLGTHVPATSTVWSGMEDALEAALRAAFAASGGQGALQIARPCLVAGAPQRGVRLVTLVVYVPVAAAAQLRAWMLRGLGGVMVTAAGRSVLAHLRLPAQGADPSGRGQPLYIFTVAAAQRTYPPASLRSYMQSQSTLLFHGMRLQWMGTVSRSGQQIVARTDHSGAALPSIDSPVCLPPFTVVGLAVEGQQVFKGSVRVRAVGGPSEQFYVRRVPNRVRYPATDPAPGAEAGQQQQQQPPPAQAAADPQPDPPPPPPVPMPPPEPVVHQSVAQQPPLPPSAPQHLLAQGGCQPSQRRSPGALVRTTDPAQLRTGAVLQLELSSRRSPRLASAVLSPTPTLSPSPAKRPRPSPREPRERGGDGSPHRRNASGDKWGLGLDGLDGESEPGVLDEELGFSDPD